MDTAIQGQNPPYKSIEPANGAEHAQSRSRHPMEILLKAGGFGFLKIGDLVEGEILEKRGTRVWIDLGPYGTGIVYGREYHIASDVIRHMNAGERVSAKVVEIDNSEGYIELSLKEAGEEKRWTDLKKIMEEGTVLELPVLEANRGGIILEARGIKGFLPASHLSAKNYPRIDGGDKEKIYIELQKLIGQTLKVKIIGVNPGEEKLIFSEKGIGSEAAEAVLSKYQVGQVVEGEITSIVDFGAFMKFDNSGFEGLIHISEIDWVLIENPRHALSLGEKVRAVIIDKQGDKISFSLKRLKSDPWEHASKHFKKGDSICGKVTRFNPFGAFVLFERKQITPDVAGGGATDGFGIQGLVHISEFGTEARMREELAIDHEYNFRVLLVDAKEHRLGLGMIRHTEKAPRDEAAELSSFS